MAADTETESPIKPFAKLVLGDSSYEVAEGANDEELLYRPTGTPLWNRLKSPRSRGWQKATAEILVSTRDALRDYVRMHLIRLSGEPGGSGPFEYDLFGFRWSYREVADAVHLKLPESDWAAVRLSEQDPPLTGRERAIDALIEGHPELHARFAPDVEAWALRISAGVQVQPVF